MRRSSIALVAVASLMLVVLSWPTSAVAVVVAPDPFAAFSPQAPAGGLSQPDLEEMLGPIALYPDELLANVLAASVYPDEITKANKYVTGNGDAAKIADQGWEQPVQAVAKIPDLVAFLADNIDWTTALGQAYIVQSTDVMTAVQSLRKKAYDNGALKSGEQQTVVQDGSTIVIQPTNPQVIYVPQYNPQVVYVNSGPSTGDVVAAGIIGFGIGVAVGACFNDNYYCNWHGGCVGWGWGHGGGYYGGHNDIDIDRNVNINTGDINIGNTDIKGGDRTNIKGGDRTSNNVGREGSKWEPNSQKVDTNKIKSGGANKLNDYKGVSSNKSAQSRVPKQTSANTGRQSSAAVTRDNRAAPKAGNSTPRAATGDRPANAAAAPRASAPKASQARVPTPRTPAPKAPSSAAKSGAAQGKPSGFSPDRGSKTSSARGSSSRSSSGASRSGGGASRGGGGGGRGGGGRR